MERAAMALEKKIIYVKVDGKLYKAKVLSIDEADQSVTLYVFNIDKVIKLPLVEEILDEITDEVAGEAPKSPDSITSPIAGQVVRIYVKPGQEVEANAPLLSIESMKMENEIRAPFRLFVKTVHIGVGDLVKQNQLLLKIKEI